MRFFGFGKKTATATAPAGFESAKITCVGPKPGKGAGKQGVPFGFAVTDAGMTIFIPPALLKGASPALSVDDKVFIKHQPVEGKPHPAAVEIKRP